MDADGWSTLSARDLAAAKALLAAGVHLAIGFHCQQAVEKTLKGLYVARTGEVPPRTHDLARLARAVVPPEDARLRQHQASWPSCRTCAPVRATVIPTGARRSTGWKIRVWPSGSCVTPRRL